MTHFFGYNCQGVAHNYYPTFLWDDQRQMALPNPIFSAHQRLAEGLDPADPASYRQFTGVDYAPDVIADAAVEFLKENRNKPFFLYFPSTIPHLALQAPDDALAPYKGRFEESPYTGNERYLPQRTPRACYAAMVTRLDLHVGRILNLLDQLGLTKRTIVVFTSDNGPAVSGLGGVDTNFFHSAGDLRGRKGSLYEGGVRTPLLVRFPERVPAGSRSDRLSGFEDWLPTLLELAGQGGLTPNDIDGISMAATLCGRSQPPRPFLYREIPSGGGQQAVWSGRWKAVRQRLSKSPAGEPLATELYDLSSDPNETTDVAPRRPEETAKLVAILADQHRPSTVFPLAAIDGGRGSRP
jgi:arylsulfatase A-like enzyme